LLNFVDLVGRRSTREQEKVNSFR